MARPPQNETLEETALRKLGSAAEHDLAILVSEEPPEEMFREDHWSLELYRAALRQCLDDIERSKGRNTT